MSANRRTRGFTLIEAMAALTILGAIIFGFVRIAPKISEFIRRWHIQNRITQDTHRATDIITRALQRGTPGTVVIQTCGPTGTPPCVNDSCPSATGLGVPPNSWIHFAILGGEVNDYYQFCWETDPNNSREHMVWMRSRIRGSNYGPTLLARNVSILSFDTDFSDPASILYSLQIEAPWDQSGLPDRIYSSSIIDRRVQMGTNP